MIDDRSFQALLAWTSPGYPVGGFTYSHGLETEVDAGRVRDVQSATDYVEAVISRGGAWVDAVLFRHVWEAAGDIAELDQLSEFAAAFRGSSETALEARQMGLSFLSVTRKAWPHPMLDAFAERTADRPVAHVTAGALACALHGLPLRLSLAAWLHGTAANLISAAVRLVPLGQTDGQIAIERLTGPIERVVSRALVTELDDLGTAAPLVELASLTHETLYTRLFRS